MMMMMCLVLVFWLVSVEVVWWVLKVVGGDGVVCDGFSDDRWHRMGGL